MNTLPTVNFFKRAKDATRVVKEGLHTMIKVVKDSFLTEMLDLPAFKVVNYSIEKNGEQDILHFLCEQNHPVGICPSGIALSKTRFFKPG